MVSLFVSQHRAAIVQPTLRSMRELRSNSANLGNLGKFKGSKGLSSNLIELIT